jgi:hypothetical protein
MDLTLEAIAAYERACRHGYQHRLLRALQGQSGRMPNLNQIAGAPTMPAHSKIGTQTIPLQRIMGSEGRCIGFDDAFNPYGLDVPLRWQRIAQAWLDGKNLPPVELIQLGDRYFVRDGHHRVSVARAFGQLEIDAFVTVWHSAQDRVDVPTPAPAGHISWLSRVATIWSH